MHLIQGSLVMTGEVIGNDVDSKVEQLQTNALDKGAFTDPITHYDLLWSAVMHH